jgi:ankyrin repeat protein
VRECGGWGCEHAAGVGSWCAVCMSAPHNSWRGVARRGEVSAGGSAMANEQLCDAAECGDMAGIAAALQAGADPNARVYGWTPLSKASFRGHSTAIVALLAAGAHVDGASRLGHTPLMLAAVHNKAAALDTLLAAGADVHRANKNGDTALHRASMWGRLDAAHVLVEAGARADVRNKAGKQPVDMVRALSLAHCGGAIASRRCTAPCADLR